MQVPGSVGRATALAPHLQAQACPLPCLVRPQPRRLGILTRLLHPEPQQACSGGGWVLDTPGHTAVASNALEGSPEEVRCPHAAISWLSQGMHGAAAALFPLQRPLQGFAQSLPGACSPASDRLVPSTRSQVESSLCMRSISRRAHWICSKEGGHSCCHCLQAQTCCQCCFCEATSRPLRLPEAPPLLLLTSSRNSAMRAM